MKQFAKIGLAAVLVAGFFTGAMAGIEPSPFINFQGVLRDAGDNPLDGNFDMTFRFFNAAAAGSEILVDRHMTGGTGAVRVTAGLFSAVLGGGAVADGSGPGIYTDLAQVSRDYATVYLEVQVGAETLSPRTRIHAAAYALNTGYLGGKAPTEYLDTSSTAQTKVGQLTLDTSEPPGGTGLTVYGDAVAGYFENTDGVGSVSLAKNTVDGVIGLDVRAYLGARIEGLIEYGVEGFGPTAGGHFEDSNASGRAYVGNDDLGISASGNDAGAYLWDRNGSAYAYIGYAERGVYALGNTAGGYFGDRDSTGSAWCGYGDLGISASGNSAGGYFSDPDSDSWAWAAYGIYGVAAAGSLMGGSFQDTNSSGLAYCGHGDYGLRGYGDTTGGYFSDTDQSGYAYVGYGDRGIWAKGTFAGGTFSHPDNVTFWADVSTATYKIHGTGAVSFEQNHPYERDKVIVYAAPEGDEVAVYTRGSAQLENGFARVALGATFSLVANPDLGLTAHLTPRGAAVPLAVESVTTSELTVRGPAGADVAFDYIVYGLRIGFEDLAVVQPKTREALLPEAAAIEASYGGRPDLRTYSAAARFRAMPGAIVRDDARGDELRRAIDGDRAAAIIAAAGMAERDTSPRPSALAEPATSEPAAERAAVSQGNGSLPAPAPVQALAQEPPVPAVLLPVSEFVDAGDVLVVDELVPGSLRRGTIASDPRVVGVAAGPAADGQAPVATYGIVPCRVDAAFGPVAAGDLLAVAPNPGHAMRAAGTGAGTILGKALEPLEAGARTIRVLVMPR
ncbi:MAG: hypothetical protein MUC67_01455 [Acidobacteria bacterium]|nr:hypothetical protein [Acidobacteriota bacterium]